MSVPSVKSEPDIRIANGVLWFKAHSIGDGVDYFASEPGLEIFLRPGDIRAVHVRGKSIVVWDALGKRYDVTLSDSHSDHRVAAWIREFAMGGTGGAG